MLEITCLNELSDCFGLDFLEREATPESVMKFNIDSSWFYYHIYIQYVLSILWVLSAVDLLFITGCRKQIYS